MATTKYLDYDGLVALWAKIKAGYLATSTIYTDNTDAHKTANKAVYDAIKSDSTTNNFVHVGTSLAHVLSVNTSSVSYTSLLNGNSTTKRGTYNIYTISSDGTCTTNNYELTGTEEFAALQSLVNENNTKVENIKIYHIDNVATDVAADTDNAEFYQSIFAGDKFVAIGKIKIDSGEGYDGIVIGYDTVGSSNAVATLLCCQAGSMDGSHYSASSHFLVDIGITSAGVITVINTRTIDPDSDLSETSTNAVQNKAVYAAINAVSTKVSNMLDGAPEAYDTLKEIADYISTHTDEYEALKALVNNKDVNVILAASSSATTAAASSSNSTNFLNIVQGGTKKTNSIKFTGSGYTTVTASAASSGVQTLTFKTSVPAATTSVAGLMSATDKSKIDNISTITTDEIDAICV